jgi:hypothetical protein
MSTDDRLRKLLETKTKEKAEAGNILAQTQERQRLQQQTAQKAAAKWGEDSRLIARILNEFQETLKDADAHLRSMDMGAKPGVGIAHMDIDGRIAGKRFSIRFTVTGDGTVMTTYSKPRGPMSTDGEEDPYFPPFKVFDATRDTYENIILSALENT